MSEAYRLATGDRLEPKEAIEYLRDPKLLCRLIESSGTLTDPVRRAALEQLVLKRDHNGV